MKRYALTQILSIFLLVLLTAGLGLYLAPRLEELLSLKEIHWAPLPTETAVPDSIFAEQRLLEKQYESALAEDITTTLEKMAGPDTVYAVVRAPLDLVQETKYLSPDTQIDTVTERVQQLSVTVLIDGDKIQNKAGRTVYQPRSKQEMKQYTDTVKSVVGFDAHRGDKVNIQNVAFAPEKGNIFGVPRPIWAGGIAFILLMALIGGIIFGVLFPVMRLMVHGMTDGVSGHKYPLIKKVIALCQKYPEQSVSVIRGWLKSPPMRKNGRSFTTAERAGILVLVLGPFLGKKITQALPSREAQQLAKIISRLGRLESRDIQEALARFLRDFYAPSYLKGTPEEAREIFTPTPSDNRDETSEKEQKRAVIPSWSNICQLSDDKIKTLLKHLDSDVLALALKSENTDTRTVFARHLPPSVWSEVVNRFSLLPESNTHRAQQIIVQTAQELHLLG